jgi:predicted PurR-regulated permease PerM
VDRKVFLALVNFAFLLGALALVVVIVGPFLRALLWAGVVGLLTYPLFRSLRRRLNERNSLAAVIMTPLVVAMLVLPVVGLIFLLTQDVSQFYHFMEEQSALKPRALRLELSGHPWLQSLLKQLQPTLEKYGLFSDRPFLDALQKVMSYLLNYSAAIFKNLLGFIVKLMLMVVALFFIYRDGETFQRNFWAVIPLDESHKRLLAETVKNVLLAVIYGLFLTSLIQGLLGGLGYWVCGLPSPLLLAVLTAAAALIPVVGAALIWAPAAGYLLIQGQIMPAVGLLLWGALVVSAIDNILRPVFISERGHLPILAVALGVLGGLAAFGFVGLIVGPLTLALFLELFRIYRLQLGTGGSTPP